jgi:CheY-like chemotaxis protein
MGAAIARIAMPPAPHSRHHARRAAADLAALYEESNGSSIMDIAYRVPVPMSGESPGAMLVMMALGIAAQAPGIMVPEFMVHVDGDRVSWEGEPVVRANPPRRLRVLLVDADLKTQSTTTRLLRKIFNADVVVATDRRGAVTAAAAIAYIKVHSPDLVVSDFQLDEGTGGDILDWSISNWKPEKFVFVSDSWEAVRAKRARKTGLSKRSLLEAIHGEQPISSAPPKRVMMNEPATGANRSVVPKRSDVRLSDSELAGLILEAISKAPPDGRFGRKVFIWSAWQQLYGDPRIGLMSYADFQRRLLDLNRGRLLDLSRADLVGAMDSTLVRNSEISSMGSTLHFITDPTAKDPWER